MVQVSENFASSKNSAAIGQLCYLMLCSPVHRGYRIDDIERLFFRPMQLGQARVWRRKGPDGEPAMVGVLTWARLSAEVEERYLKEGSLKEMSDWTSGEDASDGRLWFIDLLAQPRRLPDDRQRDPVAWCTAKFQAYLHVNSDGFAEMILVPASANRIPHTGAADVIGNRTVKACP